MVLLIAFSATAGTTGKIAGRVTDQDGNPLVGATVMVVGTSYGAMTDANGEYFIINLPPDTYTLRCSMVGMGAKEAPGVQVITDQTTRMDFTLDPEATGVTVITVTDQRGMILKDVTTSVHVVGREDIETMPVAGVADIVSRQAGMTVLDGTIHARGGRSGEVVYMVDGMSVMDPSGNFQAMSVPVSAIAETSTMTGGFGAEYGNAQSGIVNIVTREGGDSYEFDYNAWANDWQTMGFAEDWNWRDDGPFREGMIDMEGAIGGPEPISTYLLPAMGLNLPGEYRMMLTGSYFSRGGGAGDERYGLMPNDGREDISGTLKLTLRPSPRTKINLSGNYATGEIGYSFWDVSWQYSRFDQDYEIEGTDSVIPGQPLKYALPTAFVNDYSVSVGITQTMSDATFLEAKFQYMRNQSEYRTYDPDGGFIDEHYDSFSEWEDYVPERIYDSDGFPRAGYSYFQNAWILPYFIRENYMATSRVDVTSQLNNEHQLKAGVEASYYDLYNFEAQPASGGNVYGGSWHAFPNMGAAYIQDKMEYSGMIVNAGLRFDYLDPNFDQYPADLDDPVNPGTEPGDPDHIKNPVEVSMKYHLSPRVGFSHPITDRDVLHFTYGHYFQTPDMGRLFDGADYELSGAFPIVANPDLEPEETRAYEVGVKHQFDEVTLLNVTGFYKDITGLVDQEEVFYSAAQSYSRYINGDYGNVRGAELSIMRRPSNYWALNANYTYQVAQGKSSSSRQNYDYNWAGWIIPKTDSYLDWDQRHTVNANFDFRIPRGEGPRLGDYPVLEGFGVNIDWSYGSGFPFTRASQGSLEPQINGERLPWTSNTELKVNRKIWAGPVTFNLQCWVLNLFNRRNILRLADAGWYTADQDGDGEPDYDPTGSLDNPYVYNHERRIRFGLGIEW
jgi:outer membrane receptor protein involved in Fe transport